ncbi:hypothetical protein GA0061071_10210 [Kosakonia oryzendophytica]|uniref:Uncharacterized protein n=1 Tax=Kosakonia oryzendophytica TaxID=1005665 RepID=A0A1C3ZML3_9ENTR|nr:hypothetical protein DFO53_3868 [Enterobacter sp. AG5470]SCB83450.1 hypothetical protein GA0061071_10210 [Kosakonia oryzendophytica]
MPFFIVISFVRNNCEANIIQIETKNILKSGYFLRPLFTFMRMIVVRLKGKIAYSFALHLIVINLT